MTEKVNMSQLKRQVKTLMKLLDRDCVNSQVTTQAEHLLKKLLVQVELARDNEADTPTASKQEFISLGYRPLESQEPPTLVLSKRVTQDTVHLISFNEEDKFIGGVFLHDFQLKELPKL